MSECVMLIAWAKRPVGKKIRFQLVLNKTFCPTTPYPPTIAAPPLRRFSTQSSQYQNRKENKYSILKVIELGSTVSKSSLGLKILCPHLILNINFIKRESKISYP